MVKNTEDLKYDDHGNVLESFVLGNKGVRSNIYDTRIEKSIAVVNSANYSDIAFTSFEGNYKPMDQLDYSKGNWLFEPGDVKYQSVIGHEAMTGKYAYDLKAASGNYIKNKVMKANVYVLTYWVSSNDSPVVSVQGAGITPVTMVRANEVGPWRLYTGTFTTNEGDSLIIENPGSEQMYIDEVRLHPRLSMMTSYTFDPLYGITSKTDAANYITYYEYDPFGRRCITRDMRKNILEKKETVYQDLDGHPFNNEAPGNND